MVPFLVDIYDMLVVALVMTQLRQAWRAGIAVAPVLISGTTAGMWGGEGAGE